MYMYRNLFFNKVIHFLRLTLHESDKLALQKMVSVFAKMVSY
jgi:hypothetical protein